MPIEERFRLDGRVALLTGGAGMLGRRYTRTLLDAGAHVVVADVDETAAVAAAYEASKEGSSEAIGIGVDVGVKSEVDRTINVMMDRWGRVDILINNAANDPKFDKGAAEKQHFGFEDYPISLWQQSLNVNLTGAMLCAQAAGKVMVRQGRGVLVNICSTYGLVAPDQRLYRREGEDEQMLFKPADYAVTKAGIAQLTRYLAAYWGDKGIRVNSLTPGGVFNDQDESFVERYAARTPLGRMADKDEMSGAMLFLVSDASSYMTGANLVVDGGWTAW